MGKSKKHTIKSPQGEKQNKIEQRPFDYKTLSKNFEGILGATPLMRAALIEDLDHFKRNTKAEKNLKDTSRRFGLTLLHFAVMNRAHGKELTNYLVSEKNLDLKIADCQGDTPIVYALRERKFALAEELLMNFRRKKSLLHYAVVTLADPEIVKSVLEAYSADTIKKGPAFAYAVVLNTSVDMFELLLNNNILGNDDITGKSLYAAALNAKNGVNFVRYFVEKRKTECVKNLSVVDNEYSKFSPIEFALLVPNKAVAEELYINQQALNIESGSSVKNFTLFVRNNDMSGATFLFSKYNEQFKGLGKSTLQTAALHADLELNEWLWNVLTPTDLLGWNPLFDAPRNKKYGHKLVPFFISRNFALNERDESNDTTPLLIAVKNKNKAAAQAMINHDAYLARKDAVALMIGDMLRGKESCVRILNKIDKSLAKEAALTAADKERLEWMISLDLFDIHEKTDKKQSSLHLAVLEGCRHPNEVFPYLVSLGLDVNERDNCGRTPLHYALFGNQTNAEFARILFDLKADINVKINQESLLHFSAYRNSAVSAIFLIARDEHYDLINEVNMMGETALHIAARFADVDFCELLVETGIDVSAKNRFGLTALDCVPLKRVEDDQNEMKRNYLQSKMSELQKGAPSCSKSIKKQNANEIPE